MNAPLYLLDTSVVVALVRGNALGKHIDSAFGLSSSKRRPLISVVTHGEVRVLAVRNDWGASKLAVLQDALDGLVTIDINVEAVIEAYVSIELYSQRHPEGSKNMGKNDIWIAACAKAAGATLITTDKDFNHLAVAMISVEYVDPAVAKTA